MNCKNCELYKKRQKLLAYRKKYYYKNKKHILELMSAYHIRKKIRDYNGTSGGHSNGLGKVRMADL